MAPVAGTYLIVTSCLLEDATTGTVGLPSGAYANISIATQNHGSVQGDQILQAQSVGAVFITALDAGEQVTAHIFQTGTSDTIENLAAASYNFLQAVLL